MKPKYRRELNQGQLDVLRLLYKFRFSSSELVGRAIGKQNIKVVQKKLKVLEDQGYVGKRYDKTYKLRGKPAAYYITPKGARLLREHDPQDKASTTITDQGIKQLYKNTSVTEDHIAHCLSILTVHLHLQTFYGENCLTFTRVQMTTVTYLPDWLPDLFVSIKRSADKKAAPQRFFLDVWDGTRPFFVSVRKVRNYITFSEDGDWPTDQAAFPAILIVCKDDRMQKKLNRQIRKALDDSYEEMTFATTTEDNLLGASRKDEEVWQLATESDEIVSLSHI